jgi:hypothetical protein
MPVTVASLFPDTPLKQAVFAAALLAGSYVAAGLVNASPVVQPRLPNASPRGAMILVVPPSEAPELERAPSQVISTQPNRAL